MFYTSLHLDELVKRDFHALLEKTQAHYEQGNHPSDRPRYNRMLHKLFNQGVTLPPNTMNELNTWLDDMKKVGGNQQEAPKQEAPKQDVREVKYNKPGTTQSLFNPGNQPQQSEAQAKQQPEPQSQPEPAPQPESKPQPQNQDLPEMHEETPQPDDQNNPKSPLEIAFEALLKAEKEQSQQRKQQQEAQEKEQQKQQQEQQKQQQQDPKALDDLTKRVVVLEEDAVKQDEAIKKVDTLNRSTMEEHVSLERRVIDVEANYVGQQTFQDSIDAFEQKLAQVSKPTIVKIAERPEVKFEKRVHSAFAEVLFLAQMFQQVYLVGPAGSGKTSMAEDVATAMGRPFGFISCSAGMAEAHLLGRMIANGSYLSSRFVELYENGGLFLFDEVDAADANTMLVLNSALANGYLSVPNRQSKPVAQRHPDFVCLVAANTLGTGSFEYHGRNYLDAAFLDRFALSRHQVEYDLDLEREMLAGDAEMARVLHKMRFNLESTKTRRVLSTRAFISAAKLLLAGKTPQYVVDKLLLGWTDEEKNRARKDVVVPKASPLKAIGVKQAEAAKTKREQDAAVASKEAKKAELIAKEAASILRSKVTAPRVVKVQEEELAEAA